MVLAHVNGAHAGEIDQAITKTSGKLAGERMPVRLSIVGRQVWSSRRAPLPKATSRARHHLARRHSEGSPGPGARGREQRADADLLQCGAGPESGRHVDRQAPTVKLERASVMKPDTESCAVLLQGGQTGPILGAAFLAKW